MRDVYVVSATRVALEDGCPELVHAMLPYMAQNCETVTLQRLARRFGVHPNTAGALLKQATGRTFSQLLRTMRMDRAAALLEIGKIPVAQVACLCGYDNPAGFYRAFREEFATTPRAYAEKLGRDAVCV